MKKSTLNTSINILAFGSFAFLVTTGLLLAWKMPHGMGNRSTVWGLTRHAWGDVHLSVALVFLGLIGVHLILHLPWIRWFFAGSPAHPRRRRMILACGGLIAILAVCAAILLSPRAVAERGSERGQGHDGHAREEPSAQASAVTVSGDSSATSRASS